MQAVLRTGGGDVEKARGFRVFGFGVEAGEVSVCGIGVGAGCLYRSQKQIPNRKPPARLRLASPLVRGAARNPSSGNHLMEEQQIRIAAAGALVEARHDDGAELEALGLVDGHDLQVVVGRVDVGERVEAL